jgi:hypothetical protein
MGSLFYLSEHLDPEHGISARQVLCWDWDSCEKPQFLARITDEGGPDSSISIAKDLSQFMETVSDQFKQDPPAPLR